MNQLITRGNMKLKKQFRLGKKPEGRVTRVPDCRMLSQMRDSCNSSLRGAGQSALKIQRLAWCMALLAVVTTAIAAEDSQTSAEKVRNAISILKSGTEPAQKAMTCKWLAVHGNQEAVPALSPLLADPQLSSWARIALEVIPGRAADEALREAMGKLQGKLLVGVINSIGVRHDAKAVNGLIAKLKEADVEVASAAAVALGRIGGDQATRALEQSLANSTVGIRSAAA